MTATTYLEWEDQVNGSNNNTWGDVADANWAIMETAIARFLTVATTGGTTVLTSAQNRNPIIEITGVLVSNAIITVRTAEKNWTFINSTTGAFTVTVKTAAGSGKLVPRGLSVELFCDGTNVRYLRQQAIPAAQAAGTVDVITAAFEPAIVAADLIDGFTVLVEALGANATTTPTFSPDANTARTITKNGGQALVAGDIPRVGFKMLLCYDASSTRYELLNPNIDLSGYAKLVGDNAFSNTTQLTHSYTSTDPGSVGILQSYLHSSVSPAASDLIWAGNYSGKNALGTTILYGQVTCRIDDPTTGSEDGIFVIQNVVAGTLQQTLVYGANGGNAGAGLGQMGFGTWNATAFYRNGVRWDVPTEYDKGTYAISSRFTQAHGLGAYPKNVEAYLQCQTADQSYAVGDRIKISSVSYNTSTTSQTTLMVNATNVVLNTSGGQLGFASNAATPTSVGLTAASWKVIFVVYP
jgi:hypothetical protein